MQENQEQEDARAAIMQPANAAINKRYQRCKSLKIQKLSEVGYYLPTRETKNL